ncbi:hypothetical protein [Streptomyces parvus]|uniref:hypothetical protein n=1 Tax=Streptomyces parvus TaxID=66428 RepID=UPI0033E30E86
MTDVLVDDQDDNTAGDRLYRTLTAHGLTVHTATDFINCHNWVRVYIQGGPEIWITNDTLDLGAHAHLGWRAFYRPYGDDSHEGEAEVYRSTGAADFARDTAALVVAVVQYAEARSLVLT